MHVDADADDGVANPRDFGIELGEDAGQFASGQQQVVGPADIRRERGDLAYGGLDGEAGGERKPEDVCRRDCGPDKNADIEAGAGGGVPFMRAASASDGLLIGEIDGVALLALFGFAHRERVGGIDDGKVADFSGEGSAGELAVQRVEFKRIGNERGGQRHELSLPGSAFGHDAHTQVDRSGGMSERTGGDEVNAGLGVFADRVELNAAGCFYGNLEAA